MAVHSRRNGSCTLTSDRFSGCDACLIGYDELVEDWWPQSPENYLARNDEPSVRRTRVPAFKEWMAKRPESCVALVSHGSFLLNFCETNLLEARMRPEEDDSFNADVYMQVRVVLNVPCVYGPDLRRPVDGCAGQSGEDAEECNKQMGNP